MFLTEPISGGVRRSRGPGPCRSSKGPARKACAVEVASRPARRKRLRGGSWTSARPLAGPSGSKPCESSRDPVVCGAEHAQGTMDADASRPRFTSLKTGGFASPIDKHDKRWVPRSATRDLHLKNPGGFATHRKASAHDRIKEMAHPNPPPSHSGRTHGNC